MSATVQKLAAPLYEVNDGAGNYIVLAVDPVTLTHAAALALNKTICPGAAARLIEENGDPVRALARLFGARAITIMQTSGGADIQNESSGAARTWTEAVIARDSVPWPARTELGLRIISALVIGCGFYEVALEQLA